MTELNKMINIQIQKDTNDYIGSDGLIYCGKCKTPKESYFSPEVRKIIKRDKHNIECECKRKQREMKENDEKEKKHQLKVLDLKNKAFLDKSMQKYTFENDNGKNPQIKYAHLYVDNWERIQKENIGYLLWGNVGTGKSYLAACIANALIEREISVYMTNFAYILNELNANLQGRNEYICQLCKHALLIIDDFGMERSTEYGLEQVYNVIDSRYRTQKPLVVTTNLTLYELQHPQDTVHARIYDRLLEMCAPICCTGESMRKERAEQKLDRLKNMIIGK